MPQEIIAPIDRTILKQELNSKQFVRKTNFGDNEIYVVSNLN